MRFFLRDGNLWTFSGTVAAAPDRAVGPRMFGCGEAAAPGPVGIQFQVAESLFAHRGDRLRHRDQLDRDLVDWAREQRLRARDWLHRGLGQLGLAPRPVWAATSLRAPAWRRR